MHSFSLNVYALCKTFVEDASAHSAPQARCWSGVFIVTLCADGVERVMGIEPTSKAWEAFVLPLNYTRKKTRSDAARSRPSNIRGYVLNWARVIPAEQMRRARDSPLSETATQLG